MSRRPDAGTFVLNGVKRFVSGVDGPLICRINKMTLTTYPSNMNGSILKFSVVAWPSATFTAHDTPDGTLLTHTGTINGVSEFEFFVPEKITKTLDNLEYLAMEKYLYEIAGKEDISSFFIDDRNKDPLSFMGAYHTVKLRSSPHALIVRNMKHEVLFDSDGGKVPLEEISSIFSCDEEGVHKEVSVPLSSKWRITALKLIYTEADFDRFGTIFK